MSQINKHIGQQIKMYRKVQGLTLQELADRIHKSRASVSKYENGDITLDVETIYDISKALHINMNQLIDYENESEFLKEKLPVTSNRSPFYEAKRLYFYFFDGRYNRLKDGIIDIFPSQDQPGEFNATFSINSMTSYGRGSSTYYTGKVVYSDMLIRFSFVNQYNKLEEDLLYIFNPLEIRDFTEGLLCGISSADLMPCAFKCLVTLEPQEPSDELKQKLLITKKDLQRWQKQNMFIVDNRG